MSRDLDRIRAKVERGDRLEADDGLALFMEPDLLAVGALAHTVRERMHDDRAYFNRNMRVELTNVCEAECRFCAFARLEAGAPGSRTLTVEQAIARVRDNPDPKLTEVHMVNGHHPGLAFETYEAVLRGWREARPNVHRKCFTAAEIFFFAKRYAMSVEQVLARLIDAGLQSLPGGGAEIFHPDVRPRISKGKCTGDEWLDVMRAVHASGLHSNCTMLYGHVETFAHRVHHMLELRALQDESLARGRGHFQAFIPLAFHPDHGPMAKLPAPTGIDDLRCIAVARLLLDNIAHIKSYWVSSTPKVAQIALRFGADDIDGTIVHETIYHDAGSTSPQGLSREELVRLVWEAGCTAVERDTLYRSLEVMPRPAAPEASLTMRERPRVRRLAVMEG
jgi:aminodeoxyfutalosine synthase